MAVWFRNKETGVAWEVEGERQLDIARGNADLEEIGEEAPERAFELDQEVQTTEPTGDPIEPEGDTKDALDGLGKKELVELAKSMEIPTSGKNVEQLKAAIREA